MFRRSWYIYVCKLSVLGPICSPIINIYMSSNIFITLWHSHITYLGCMTVNAAKLLNPAPISMGKRFSTFSFSAHSRISRCWAALLVGLCMGRGKGGGKEVREVGNKGEGKGDKKDPSTIRFPQTESSCAKLVPARDLRRLPLTGNFHDERA